MRLLKIISLSFIMLALTNFSLFADSLSRGKQALESAEFELAIKELTPLAEEGNVEAQFLASEAIRFWMLSWPKKWSNSAYSIYLIHLDYLERAAFSGHAEAAWILGKAYIFDEGLYERGVTNDLDRSMYWIEKAAARGVVTAEKYLKDYFPLPRDKEDASVVLRGSVACSEWRHARKTNSSLAIEHYAHGFLNGHVVGKKEDFWTTPDTITKDVAFLELDIICENNSSFDINEALAELIGSRQ